MQRHYCRTTYLPTYLLERSFPSAAKLNLLTDQPTDRTIDRLTDRPTRHGFIVQLLFGVTSLLEMKISGEAWPDLPYPPIQVPSESTLVCPLSVDTIRQTPLFLSPAVNALGKISYVLYGLGLGLLCNQTGPLPLVGYAIEQLPLRSIFFLARRRFHERRIFLSPPSPPNCRWELPYTAATASFQLDQHFLGPLALHVAVSVPGWAV